MPRPLLPAAFALLLHAAPARAFLPEIPQFPQPLADALVEMVGLGTDHRPLEPATALGKSLGLEFGVEVTLSRPPDSMTTAMRSAGLLGAEETFALPILPSPKFHLKKGLSSWVGVGLSGVYFPYQGASMLLLGGDMKFTLLQPEEGPTWAVRVAYSESRIMYATTRTLSPQLVVSRALDFADPYIGIGYQISRGTLLYEQEIVPGLVIPISASGSAQAFIAFTGVQFQVNPLGLQLTLEGTYSTATMHSLATRVGFRF